MAGYGQQQDPRMDFLQLLFSPNLNPQMQMQLAQQLAVSTPPPQMPQPPGMDMMLNPQQPQVPIPQVQNPLGMLMPGEQGGIPTQMPAPVEDRSFPTTQQKPFALTPEQMKMFQGYMNSDPKVPPAVAPPGQRALMPMAQIPNPQAFATMPTLAMLLQGRR